ISPPSRYTLFFGPRAGQIRRWANCVPALTLRVIRRNDHLFMPRNDEGDFELVLGNRQLLSGFFIVVILFAIFFSMGYIVGRHSTPAPMDTTASAAAPESAALR